MNHTNELSAIIFDIQRGSMVDGPGLRTTVFLKGCPLRCSWCHNPEGIQQKIQTVLTEEGKQKTYGESYTLEDLWHIIEKDRPFYNISGGGLTISGGEPMNQFEFTEALACHARTSGVHVALDSTGFGSRQQWDTMIQYVDLFMFDYKMTSEKDHRSYTGIDGKALHNNMRYVASQGAPIRLRCPIIPEINDTEEHFSGIYEFAIAIPNLIGVDLLPYHDTARYKYDQLGLPYTITAPTPQQAEMRSWIQQILAYGSIPDLRVAGLKLNE